MTIRLRRFDAAVPYRATFASACALIGFGGTHRRVGDGATIGFHAVSDKGKASPKGNAAVVRYLDWLGLHVAAEYVTGTPPQSIDVLTREKATNYDNNCDPFTLDEINRYHKVRDKHFDPPPIIHDPGLPSIE